MANRFFNNLVFILFWFLLLDLPSSLFGKIHYVDPKIGSAGNDGSINDPWKTLQEVFENDLIETQAPAAYPYQPGTALVPKNQGAPVQSGDTLFCKTGYHGEIFFRGAYNQDFIVIAAAPGHRPTFKSIRLSAVSHWILDGLRVSPELAPQYNRNQLIDIESHSYHGPSS